MATPYLQRANLTNAMTSGLAARLAYLNRKKGGRTSGGSSGRGGSSERIEREPGAPFSPERRAAYRKNVLAERIAETGAEQAEANVAATEAKTESTRAGTNALLRQEELVAEGVAEKRKTAKRKEERLTRKEERELEQLRLDKVATGFKNAVRFVPQINKNNYGDWFNWVSESNFAPTTMFKSPEKVARMDDADFADYKKSLSALETPNVQLLKLAAQQYDKEQVTKAKEQAAKAKVVAAAKKADASIAAAVKKQIPKSRKELVDLGATIFASDEGGTNATNKEGFAVDVKVYNEIAEELGYPDRIVWDETREEPGAVYGTNVVPGYVRTEVGGEVAPAAAVPEDVLAQYRIKYPGRTDDEIIAALTRAQAKGI